MIRQRRFELIPALLICVMATYWLSSAWIVFVPTVIAVLSAFFSRRAELDTIGQSIVALFVLALVYVFYFVWQTPVDAPTGRLSVLGQAGAVFCVALVAIRLWLATPWGGRLPNAFILLASWLFLGLETNGATYLLFCVPGVMAVLPGAMNGNLERKKRVDGRIAGQAIVLIIIGGTLSAGFIIGIPHAYRWLEARFLQRMSLTATGFSPVLELGPVGEMFVSNSIMFRAFAVPSSSRHLRGAVYNTYSGRYWTNSIVKQKRPVPPLYSPRGAHNMDIRLTSRESRLFVPLNTNGVTSAAEIEMDSLGIVTVRGGESVDAYRVHVSPPSTRQLTLPPVAEDTAVPDSLQKPLQRWVRRYVPKNTNSARQLAAIQLALEKHYTYSLTFSRARGQDALIDFLYRNKRGHCEYFASAFALLSRITGVPARVVSGYQLKEYNAMGGYYIVREKHAHAWTEVWLNGRWRTIDPTPPGEGGESRWAITNGTDLLWVWLLGIKDKLLLLDRYAVLGFIGGLLGIWGLIVWRRRLKKTAKANHVLEYGTAHDVLIAIESMLVDTLPRKRSEPIEDWAERLTTHDASLAPLAMVLNDYADWRYGEQGDIDVIVRRFKEITGK